jgi:hypothetical protein
MTTRAGRQMAERHTSSTRWSIRTPNLRLEFQSTPAGWMHWIEVRTNSEWVEVARSVERDPELGDARRVVSPTYQDIEFQDGTDHLGTLLLGQFGPHHFSAVCAVWQRENAVGIDVDVADRCRTAVDLLACTYRLPFQDKATIAVSEERVAWLHPAGELVLEGLGSTRVAVLGSETLGTAVQVSPQINQADLTHRCIYRWIWQPAETESATE